MHLSFCLESVHIWLLSMSQVLNHKWYSTLDLNHNLHNTSYISILNNIYLLLSILLLQWFVHWTGFLHQEIVINSWNHLYIKKWIIFTEYELYTAIGSDKSLPSIAIYKIYTNFKLHACINCVWLYQMTILLHSRKLQKVYISWLNCYSCIQAALVINFCFKMCESIIIIM